MSLPLQQHPCSSWTGRTYEVVTLPSSLCDNCGWTWEAHSPQARLLHESQLYEGAVEVGRQDCCPTCLRPYAQLSDPDANRAGIAGSRRTSAAAALRVQPRTGTQRRRILDYITEHGPATDEQIQRALDLSGNTERPRRVELVEGGWLEVEDAYGSGGTIRWGLTTQARARLQGAA